MNEQFQTLSFTKKKDAPTFGFERETNLYIPLFIPLKSFSIIPSFLFLKLCVLRSIVVLN